MRLVALCICFFLMVTTVILIIAACSTTFWWMPGNKQYHFGLWEHCDKRGVCQSLENFFLTNNATHSLVRKGGR